MLLQVAALSPPKRSSLTSSRLRACGAELQPGGVRAGGESEPDLHGGVERGQRNVGVVNLHRMAEVLGMSLSELFAVVEGAKQRDG